MSEPMSSHEIEDVLSSIRRLVSDDLRPAASRGAAAPAGDKLILTPALRVVGAAEQAAEAPSPEAVMEAEPEQWIASDETSEIRDDLKAMLDGPEREESAAQPVLDPMVFHSSRTVEKDIAPTEDPEAAFQALILGGVSGGWADSVTPAQPIHDEIEGTMEATVEATVEANVEEHVPVWQSDWSEPVVQAYEDTEEEPAEVAPVGVAEIAAEQAAPVWLDAVEPEAGWAEAGEDWVEEQPDPLVATAAPRRAPVAPDPLAKAWADRAEEAVRAELQEAALAAAGAKMDDGLFVEDVGPVDEEALREIVRDIIREELAGTLGERITRNVRKLVRVEINRALAAREFE